MSGQSKTCLRCGAPNAELFANDGTLVCDTCFSYDQVVSTELRVSQVGLGVAPTGEVADLEASTRKVGTRYGIVAGVLALVALWLLSHGPHEEVLFAGGILTLIVASVMTVYAYRMLRFAKNEAPEVVRRASSRPPGPTSKFPTSRQ